MEVFFKNNWFCKNCKDKETRFHTLPAGKKEKCENQFFDYDENVFDINYIVPSKYQFHESNNGQCMLYALLLLIHTNDEELASRLLIKSKEDESQVYSWEWLFKGGNFGKFINKNSPYNLQHGKKENGKKLSSKKNIWIQFSTMMKIGNGLQFWKMQMDQQIMLLDLIAKER